jgi:pyridoxine kinase
MELVEDFVHIKAPRILSIQSHTVHGFVGNKAVAFPLQTMGFDMDCINTITLSNHPAYAKGTKGQSLEPEVLNQILQGLEDNDLLRYDLIMNGYTRFPGHLEATARVIAKIKEKNPAAIFVCDPVLGDNEAYYVPEELLQKYIDHLLPLATAITPNVFECQALSGKKKIETLFDAIEAAKTMHTLGPKIVMMTGLPIAANDYPTPHLSMLLSFQSNSCSSTPPSAPIIFRVDVPMLEGYYAGCGDLFSALIAASLAQVVHKLEENPFLLGPVLEHCAAAMNAVLQQTKTLQSRELCIVESRDIFIRFQEQLRNLTSRPLGVVMTEGPITDNIDQNKAVLVSHPKVIGIIFDMDGTLTEDGALNYQAMYERSGLKRHSEKDLLTLVNELPEDKKIAAMQVIYEEEMAGINRQVLRKGLYQFIYSLYARKIRLAVCTRNCQQAYIQFLQQSQLLEHHFIPALFRETFQETNIQKPNPELAHYIARAWSVPEEQKSLLWFVGDSLDDMKCGKNAGLTTCLILTDHNQKLQEQYPSLIDHTISDLDELLAILELPAGPPSKN